MAHYYVKSPFTGKWFDGPYLGTVRHKEQAHHYWEGDPHLHFLVGESLKIGRVKLILRQVEEEDNTFTLDNLTAKFEKDMDSDPPVPVLEPCEECNGTGHADWDHDLPDGAQNWTCQVCDGTGMVTVART